MKRATWVSGATLALVASFVLFSGATACDSKPVQKRSPTCPEGTMLVGKYCVISANRCPEGFEYDDARRACYLLCPDAGSDAEIPWLCQPEDAGQ